MPPLSAHCFPWLSNRRTTGRRSRGFTLTELLVVIAIIAVLAAIIFPVFATVREKGRQTTCSSNLRQMGMAFLQYTQDYDEIFPCGFTHPGDDTQGSGWAAQIYPYIKSTGVYRCPDDPTQSRKGSNGATLYPVSYALNASTGDGVLRLQGFASPADTTLMIEVTGARVNMTDPAEAGSPYHSPVNDLDEPFFTDPSGNEVNGVSRTQGGIDFATGPLNTNPAATEGWQDVVPGPPRHGSGSLWLFADGHVRWLDGRRVCNYSYDEGEQPKSSPNACAAWEAPQ